MKTADEIPVMPFSSQVQWLKWLEKHHATSAGIWLQLAKKGSGIISVDYPGALEAALCYGWIDGQKKPFDDQFWLQKFVPRRPRSIWSKINCEKATGLIAAGKMKPAGLKEVERARADGRWENAYDSQGKAIVPEDLQQALDRQPAAKKFFATLDSANRYAILFRIHQAKKPETRTARIEKFVSMLAEKKTIHPLKK